MSQAYPRELRDVVVSVARRSPASVARVAADFGVPESCLHEWLRAADAEDERNPGIARESSTELRELRARQRVLEQENEVLRGAVTYLSRGLGPK